MFDVGFASTSTTSPMILFGLMLMAILYSSIGHGGASGYLVVLSLTSFGMMESVWLKQNVWCLNLIVSSIAFYHYRNSGFHDWRLTLPFIVSSVPMVIIGSYMRVDGAVYDILLSFVLLFAAWRLIETTVHDELDSFETPGFRQDLHLIGGGIGFASGMVGLGGGVFLSPVIILKKWGSPKATAATAAVFVWVNSAAGLVGSSMSNGLGVELSSLAPFALAVLIGGFIGSRYGASIASERHVRAFLVVVLVVASTRRVLGVAGLWV